MKRFSWITGLCSAPIQKALFSTLFLSLATLLYGQKPELVLPLIHSNPVEGAACSNDGHFLVSTAEDGIKIWELASGNLIRTIPAPVDSFFSAAAAISSDAKWLLAETYDPMRPLATTLEIYDPATGKKLRRFYTVEHPWLVESMAFSAKNSYVLTVLKHDSIFYETRVFDLKTGAKIRTFPGAGRFDDSEKTLLLENNGVLSMANIKTGKLDIITNEPVRDAQKAGDVVIILTKDWHIKRWNALSKTITADLTLQLGTAYLDTLKDWPGHIYAQIARDGARCVIGLPVILDSENAFPRWALETDIELRFRVFDTHTGQQLSANAARTMDEYGHNFYSPNLSFLIAWPNSDVRSTLWAYPVSANNAIHSMGLDELLETTYNNFIKPEIGIYNQGKIILLDRTQNKFTASSVYFTETGFHLALGGSDSLNAFIADQALVKDPRWSVECADGLSYQLKKVGNTEPVATFLLADGKERTWAITTPTSLFDASPGMMQSLHFICGMEMIDLEQLKDRYFEPGLLAKIMGLSDEPIRDVAVFDSVPLYPVVRLQLDTMQNKLMIQLSPRNGGLGKVSVFIGDKEIIEDANPSKFKGIEKSRDSLISIELDKYARYFLTDTLNTVSVRAYNEAGWLKSAAKSVEYRPVFARKRGDDTRNGGVQEPKPLMNRQPNLHILVVGTSDYAGDKLDLQYPDKDARDIAHALEQIGKQLFPLKKGKVFVHLLSTDTLYTSPTKSNIKAAFEEIKTQSKAEDILIAYFSGHGITYGDADQALFYYLTREIGDFNLSDPGTREKRCISSVELSKWIKSDYSKKQVLILDACNSGKMVESLSGGQKALSSSQILAFDRMKDRTGLFILAGSAADKVSYEASQYAQGLLTFSLLEGINGLAHPNSNLVDVMELFQYACNRVPQLAKDIGGIQTPMLLGPSKGSFHIGEKNDSVQIKLADPKPVFIRNVFLDQTFGDELNLVGALEDILQRSNTKGAETDMVYADVREYENGYSIRGTYAIKKPNVEVNASLFKGKKLQGTFKVTWNNDDVPGLASKIIEKAFSLIKS